MVNVINNRQNRLRKKLIMVSNNVNLWEASFKAAFMKIQKLEFMPVLLYMGIKSLRSEHKITVNKLQCGSHF